MADIFTNMFGTPEKHRPLPSLPPKMPEYPSGKNAEHDFRIAPEFPSQGSAQPAHQGSQSSAPSQDDNQYSDTK